MCGWSAIPAGLGAGIDLRVECGRGGATTSTARYASSMPRLSTGDASAIETEIVPRRDIQSTDNALTRTWGGARITVGPRFPFADDLDRTDSLVSFN